MTSLRERRRQQLRDEIIDATQTLMAEKGFIGMSMEDVAARVGVSKPTLYNQFPTKEDLVVAVTTAVLRHQLDMIQQASKADSPLDQLCEILHTIISLQVEKQSSALAQIRMPELLEIIEKHPATLALLHRLDAAVLDLVEAAIKRGEIAEGIDKAAVALMFHGAVCAIGMSGEIKTFAPDLETIPETLTTIFRRGVGRSMAMP
jgi:AcrR family transcriptional regulator